MQQLYILKAQEEEACPPLAVQRTLFCHPGDRTAAIEFCKQQRLGTRGIKYQVIGPIGTYGGPDPLVLCIQQALPPIPAIDPRSVQAALSNPHGQAGQNRPDGQLDSGGFQELGDHALPTDADQAVFGEVTDGTYSDIVQDGGAAREIPRPRG